MVEDTYNFCVETCHIVFHKRWLHCRVRYHDPVIYFGEDMKLLTLIVRWLHCRVRCQDTVNTKKTRHY